MTDSSTQRRTVYLAAQNRHIYLSTYLNAVRIAKRHPDHTFDCGLTTWWPVTGAEVVQQFRRGIHDRINQGISYSQRGVAS